MFFKHFASKHQRPGLSINELKNGLNSFYNNFVMSKMWIIIEMFCAIWYHLHNLKNVKNTHGGVLLLVKLKVTLLYWYVSRFLNYISNGTKLRKLSLIVSNCLQWFPRFLKHINSNIFHSVKLYFRKLFYPHIYWPILSLIFF